MKNNYNIILASKSPRRAEILKMIGIDFRVVPSELKENINTASIKLDESILEQINLIHEQIPNPST